MRAKIVAGNWKMNKTVEESKALAIEIAHNNENKSDKRVLIAPTSINLNTTKEAVKNTPVEVIAQNVHQNVSGAFTGEISASMLKSIDVQTVIVGHSERRAYFNETNELLAQKVSTAIENGLEIIFCVGESLEERKSSNHFEVVSLQLSEGLFQLEASAWKQVVIAYEPVWAIGTGETASPMQAQEMHAFIRKCISEKYSDELANAVSILYGGSVKPTNATEIFSNPDVDGGLIGGASLNSEDFQAIINAL